MTKKENKLNKILYHKHLPSHKVKKKKINKAMINQTKKLRGNCNHNNRKKVIEKVRCFI